MDNDEFNFTCPEGISYRSAKEYIWCSVLGFCGCYSDLIYDLTFKILDDLYDAHKTGVGYYYEYEGVSEDYQGLQELILHVLDSKGLTDHGCSVRGSWLSEKGVKLYEKYLLKDVISD